MLSCPVADPAEGLAAMCSRRVKNSRQEISIWIQTQVTSFQPREAFCLPYQLLDMDDPGLIQCEHIGSDGALVSFNVSRISANVSTGIPPVSNNLSRKCLRLRARVRMIASRYR